MNYSRTGNSLYRGELYLFKAADNSDKMIARHLNDIVRTLNAAPLRLLPENDGSYPYDGSYVLLAGPSGYVTTPLRMEVCRYDAKFRPLNPWVNHSNDAFTDGGAPATHWAPLPKIEARL